MQRHFVEVRYQGPHMAISDVLRAEPCWIATDQIGGIDLTTHAGQAIVTLGLNGIGVATSRYVRAFNEVETAKRFIAFCAGRPGAPCVDEDFIAPSLSRDAAPVVLSQPLLQDHARRAVLRLEVDMADRRWLRDEWRNLDEAQREMVRSVWIGIVADVIRQVLNAAAVR